MKFSLTDQQIEANFTRLLEYATEMFPTRRDKLMSLYESMEIQIATAPASGTEYFHNAFPGGFLEHTLRVLEFSFSVFENWKSLGLDVSTFSSEELAFVAIHHDFGKLGFPGDGNERYIWNENDYTQKKGVIYESNPNIPRGSVQHVGLYLLQRYGVQVSWNEYQGIMIHDGLYEDANKYYYISYQHNSRLRTNLPFIIHQADLMASQFEYERWAEINRKTLKPYTEE